MFNSTAVSAHHTTNKSQQQLRQEHIIHHHVWRPGNWDCIEAETPPDGMIVRSFRGEQIVRGVSARILLANPKCRNLCIQHAFFDQKI